MKRAIPALLLALMIAAATATSAVAQQTATPGALCTPEGATGRTAEGTAVTCTRSAGEDQPRWRVSATQQTPPTQPPVAATPTTAVQSVTTETTTSTAMPRTGDASGETAALGFGVLFMGVLAVWWARPRIAAFMAGPRVIEPERVDRAHHLLGWSDAWENHLDKPYWLRHNRDD